MRTAPLGVALVLALVLAVPLPTAMATVGQSGFGLVLERLEVDVSIKDVVAVTEIAAIYRNPHGRAVEEQVEFTVSRSAVLTAFRLTVGNDTREGFVRERTIATAVYDEAVKQGEHAVLVRSAGKGALSLRINVPANSTARVEAVFAEVLPLAMGVQNYAFPVDRILARHEGAEHLEVTVRAESTHGWAAAAATGLAFEPVESGANVLAWRHVATGANADDAVRVTLSPKAGDYRSTLVVSGFDDDAGAVFTILPPSTATPIPLDIVLVIDVSGSMVGTKIEQARNALHAILDQLRASDRFALVKFSTGVETHSATLQYPQPVALAAAHEWVDGLRAEGGTDIASAMETGIGLAAAGLSEDRLPVVVLITDGQPTVGLTNRGRIVDAVAGWNTGEVRVHTVGIGFDQDDAFLNELAAANRGQYRAMDRQEDASVLLADFVHALSLPVLKDIVVSFPGLRATEIHPRPIGDLYHGSHLVIAARINASALPDEVIVRIHGRDAITPIAYDVVLDASDVVVASEAEQLWARQKAVTLERRLELAPMSDDSEAVRSMLVALGTRYQIETRETAWVVTSIARAPVLGSPFPLSSPPPADDPAAPTDRGIRQRTAGTENDTAGAQDFLPSQRQSPGAGLVPLVFALAVLGVLVAVKRRQ